MASFHQSLEFQEPDGLADRTPPNSELFRQHPLRRQTGAVLQRALAYAGLQLVDDVLVEPPPLKVFHA